ncbi:MULTISPECIES: LysR family transcriptional regulator [unclassified Pseudoclavibacter]|uniref:LysR family transcriptional regulator n=1 Tax=unclassified Pseudoclavibacter TaxID=2615177 RepID=UPI000CE832FC|nr:MULTISPECIES: LysR family transcriptional regulator [unclassified Pseudoclavibacter]MBF4551467.1 LysR family transcriptional regulator [Pseudoclavibacter sp. VKM Ac-2888]PPF78541.1 LysR family transcriptional regulator [Pseudoclavibacter sp. Z016]
MSDLFDAATLSLLLDVVDAGSITSGAERANMTVSAASQRITKLEKSIGQPVLVRLPRGVQVTEAGAVLVERARLFRREMRAARGDLEALRGLERGTVRLGSFPTVSASLLSDALKSFHHSQPSITVQVRSALRPRLVEMLHSSEVELALMWSYAWTEAAEQSLSLVPVATDRTVLLVAADSEIEDNVTVRSLRSAQWIIRNDRHPASEVLFRACAAARFEPRVVYEAHDYQEIEAMVAAGVGIAMVPELAIAHHRPDVRMVRFAGRDEVPSRSITIASLARRQYTPAMYAISRAIHDAARSIAQRGQVQRV